MTVLTRIQIRRGTTTEWTTANPILAVGEFGLDTTISGIKIGDGVTDWVSLQFRDAATWLLNSATSAAEVITRTNLANSPYGISGWNTSSGYNSTYDSTKVRPDGGFGARKYTKGSTDSGRYFPYGRAIGMLSTASPTSSPVNTEGLVVVEPNKPYGIGVYAMPSIDMPTGGNAHIAFRWITSTGAFSASGAPSGPNQTMLTANNWRWVNGVATAPADAKYLSLELVLDMGVDGNTLVQGAVTWATMPLIEQRDTAPMASDYIDGGTATSGTTTYRWSGLSGLSSSYQMSNANLVKRTASGTLEASSPINDNDVVNKKYLESQTPIVVNAKGGATDTGGTDECAIFQAAVDKARGSFGFGGQVRVMPGAYHVSNSIKMYSNVHIIGYGAVLRKYSSSTTYSVFETLSNGATGYGSGGSNISFEGLTFQGVYGAGSTGICVTLHHAENVTFKKCTWTEAIISGHAIDLLGCKGVLIDDCVFKGFKVTATREYVEAIQCDYSMAGAGGSETIVTSWDGLPTINVTLRNSKFLPLTVGGTLYPAPNLIGSHSRLETRWIENIKILDNYIEGGIATDASVIADSFSTLTRGWIHFFCARNIEIIGNTFKNTAKYTDASKTATFGKPVAARVLMCYPISTGTLLSDIQNASATSQPITPMPVENLVVERNIFDGFNTDITGESICDIRGTSANKFRDISFLKNRYVNCWPTPGTLGDKGQDPIYLQDGVGATLRDNEVQYARGLVYAFRVTNLKIFGGLLKDIGFWTGRFSECSDVVIDSVDLINFSGAYWSYNNLTADSSLSPQAPTSGFTLRGGSVIQGYTSTQLSGQAAQPISLSGTNQFWIDHVRAPYNSATGYTKLISAYNGAVNGTIEKNMTVGWLAQVQTGTALGVASLSGTNLVSQANTV